MKVKLVGYKCYKDKEQRSKIIIHGVSDQKIDGGVGSEVISKVFYSEPMQLLVGEVYELLYEIRFFAGKEYPRLLGLELIKKA